MNRRHLYTCMTVLFLNLFLYANNSIASSFFSSDKDIERKVEKLVLNTDISIVPQINKLSAGFGTSSSGEYYFTKSISKIFFQDKTIKVKVSEMEFDEGEILLTLNHTVLGSGKIKFIFNDEYLKKLPLEEIRSILSTTLSNENWSYVFVNKSSKVFHLHSCNHLSSFDKTNRIKLDEARTLGYKSCGFCFSRLIYLPGVAEESQLREDYLKHFSPFDLLLNDPAKQAYIKTLGENILRRWPTKLLGYQYTFQIIESNRVNAFAVPMGKIFITSALLNSLESEIEIEAVLAHEIAHVERRHAMRQLAKNAEEVANDQALAALAGIAIGATTLAMGGGRHGNFGATLGATIGALAVYGGIVVSKILISGYHKDLEREADLLSLLYLDVNKKDKRNSVSVFKKFQFQNLQTKSNPDPTSKTHPYLQERISRTNDTKILHFNNNKSYIFEKKDKSLVQIDFVYQSIYQKENRLYVYINDYSLIDDYLYNDFPMSDNNLQRSKPTIKLRLKSKSDEQTFWLNQEATVRDTWGAHLVFENPSSKDKANFIEEPVELILIAEVVEEKSGSRSYDFPLKPGIISFAD